MLPTQTPLDLSALLRDGRHFVEKRGDRVHIIDSLTGNTYVMYDSSSSPGVPTHFEEQTLPTGVKIWTEVGAQPLPQGGVREIAYSPTVVHLICQQIVEGRGITNICKDPGMPSYVALRAWAKQHPWIDDHLNQARRDRAETLRDEAVTTAMTAVSKDPIDASALQVDTLRWAASVDHERYNPKTKVEATINTPTQIVVFTGIDRTPERDVTTIPTELQKYDK